MSARGDARKRLTEQAAAAPALGLESARQELVSTPITVVKDLVDSLAFLAVTPLHLHVDTRVMLDQRPRVNVWLATRTDYERVVAALALKSVERMARTSGQREWYAEDDTTARALLVQCVSFVHHADWQARPIDEQGVA